MSGSRSTPELTLDGCLRLVRSFHQRIKAPIAPSPTLLNCDSAAALAYSEQLFQLSHEIAASANGMQDQLLCRTAMVVEELAEWLAAHAKGDQAAAADALGDRLYLLLGDAVATGMPLMQIFEAVHESNVSKLPLVTTAVGKAFKGPGYQAPDLATLLAEHAANRPYDATDHMLDDCDDHASES
jgi:predicted HAD superfamily Cof-like phosphohydrolase